MTMKQHHKAYGRDLEFIRRIRADGTSEPTSDDTVLHYNTLFRLTCLSISKGTYIASGMSTYVVKVKPTIPTPKDIYTQSEVQAILRDLLAAAEDGPYVPNYDKMNEVVKSHGLTFEP